MLGQPKTDILVFMSRVIVHDNMEIKLRGHVGIDVAEELEELLMAVTLLALAHHLAGSDIESGKECRRAMAQIVVRIAFQIAQAHRKSRLTALQSLTLAFLVHTENQCVCRGIQIEADDVPDFFHEERVGRQLESPTAVRFDPKRTPDPLDGGLRYPGFGGKVPASPMGAVGRLGVEGLFEQLSNFFVGNAPRSARPQFVML